MPDSRGTHVWLCFTATGWQENTGKATGSFCPSEILIKDLQKIYSWLFLRNCLGSKFKEFCKTEIQGVFFNYMVYNWIKQGKDIESEAYFCLFFFLMRWDQFWRVQQSIRFILKKSDVITSVQSGFYTGVWSKGTKCLPSVSSSCLHVFNTSLMTFLLFVCSSCCCFCCCRCHTTKVKWIQMSHVFKCYLIFTRINVSWV